MSTMAERPSVCPFDNPVSKQHFNPSNDPSTHTQYNILSSPNHANSNHPPPSSSSSTSSGNYDHPEHHICPLDDPEFLSNRQQELSQQNFYENQREQDQSNQHQHNQEYSQNQSISPKLPTSSSPFLFPNQYVEKSLGPIHESVPNSPSPSISG